jgi:hypothetical protein
MFLAGRLEGQKLVRTAATRRSRNYTATHFSPVLIVKVASAVNEVTAGYNVDEHQLEITLKNPERLAVATGHGQELEKNRRVRRSLARPAFGCTANRLVSGVCNGTDSVICHHTKQFLPEWTHRRCDQLFQEKRCLTL